MATLSGPPELPKINSPPYGIKHFMTWIMTRTCMTHKQSLARKLGSRHQEVRYASLCSGMEIFGMVMQAHNAPT